MDLVQHTKNAIMLVLHNQSKLTKDEFNMEGMSGMRGRMFLNNMCSVSDVKYLEIGLWKGSTFCSALKDNAVRALGIDNWSQFHGPKDECLKNIERYSGSNKVEIIDADCFSIDTSKFNEKFNVYFYDGDHTADSQEKALTYFDSILDDTFVAIIDDYKDDDVKLGTQNAVKKLNYTTLFSHEFIVPHGIEDNVGWWNGMLIAVYRKFDPVWSE